MSYPSKPGFNTMKLLKTIRQLKHSCNLIRVEVGNLYANSHVYLALDLRRMELYTWFLRTSKKKVKRSGKVECEDVFTYVHQVILFYRVSKSRIQFPKGRRAELFQVPICCSSPYMILAPCNYLEKYQTIYNDISCPLLKN